ncbi:MAG: hypothetical protein NTW19_15355 [Planctomycetota bacterium]|nr:hypothetical protein [Planctomycetota bacterium]
MLAISRPRLMPAARALRAAGALPVILPIMLLVALCLGGQAPAPAAKPAPPPPKDSFVWPGHTIAGAAPTEQGPFTLTPDEAAESKREVVDKEGKKTQEPTALQYRVSRRVLARARGPITVVNCPFIPFDAIDPGLYRVRARIAFDGDLGVSGTPIVLAANSTGPEEIQRYNVTRSFCPLDFAEAEKYTEISLLFEVAPAGDKRLPTRRIYDSFRWGGIYYEVYPDAQKPAPSTNKPDPRAGVSVNLSLPPTNFSVGSGMPSNSLRWLRVDWVRMDRIEPSPSIAVRHVHAQKVWMRPGMENAFEVALENFRDGPQKRKVDLVLERGLNERSVIDTREVELAPGERKTYSVVWKTDEKTPLWGWRAVAEVRPPGSASGSPATIAAESSASECFSVHPLMYAVQNAGMADTSNDPFRQPTPYKNIHEVFASSGGDCAGIMPRKDAWIMGISSGGVPQTFKLVEYAARKNLEQGVSTMMYLFGGGTGTYAMDLYVQHPEWFSGRSNMTDNYYAMRRAREEYIENYDFEKGPPPTFEIPMHWIEPGMNHWFPELKEKIEREAVEFVKRTGYQGIRFDVGIFAPKTTTTVLGTPLPFDMAKAQEHAAKNFNDFRDKLRAVNPNFEFGANMDSWNYLEQVGVRKVTPRPPEEFPEFVALMKAHGSIVDEGTMNHPRIDHYMNRFEDAWWSLNEKRRVVRRLGGYYQHFGPFRAGGNFCHDDIYWGVMMVVSGIYSYSGTSAPAYSQASLGEFITRYSEFFRSDTLKPLDDAADLLTHDAGGDLWFAQAATWDDVGGKRRYVIPLLNPPVVERFRLNKTNEMPRPIEPFNITLAVPAGHRSGEAWMLSWEPKVEAVKLESKLEGGKLKIKFPGLKLCRTLVVEFQK